MLTIPRRAITKARIYNSADNSFIEFQYNPSNFKDSIGVVWNEIQGAGMSYPILQYGGGRTRTINFSLFVNGVDKPGSVRKTINFLNDFLPPASVDGYQFVSPPKMIFSFGWFVKPCILQNMETDYNYFSSKLQPLMATIDLTLAIIQ